MESLHAEDLISIGAIPDDSIMQSVDGRSELLPALMATLIISGPSQASSQVPCSIIASPFTADLISQRSGRKIFGVNNPEDYGCRREVSGHARYRAGVRAGAAQHCGLRLCRHSYSQGIIVYANDSDRSHADIGRGADFARLRLWEGRGVGFDH